MDYSFQLTDTSFILMWKEKYFDKFVGGEMCRTKTHYIPPIELSNLISYLSHHSDEINRLTRRYTDEEKHKLESELLNITSRLKSIS